MASVVSQTLVEHADTLTAHDQGVNLHLYAFMEILPHGSRVVELAIRYMRDGYQAFTGTDVMLRLAPPPVH